MRQNREDIDNRSPNPTILEQDRLGTRENQRPRTCPKSLARNRPSLEGEVCAPRSEAPSRRPEDFQSNPIRQPAKDERQCSRDRGNGGSTSLQTRRSSPITRFPSDTA